MIWLILTLGVLTGTYLVAERRRPPMGSTLRDAAPGQFADLPGGQTHYQWHGPANGPVAVCVHGLSTSSYVWDQTVQSLTHMGFRVLRYDLYGRGYSDRPSGAQDSAFFVSQLHALLKTQAPGKAITLVGYSMGGAITAAYTQQYPSRVDRMILIAPVGFGTFLGRWSDLMTSVPLIGDWLMTVCGGVHMRQSLRRSDSRAFASLNRRQKDETRIRGFLTAVLSSQRHILKEDLSEAHKSIARADIPVLAIWGALDSVIPERLSGQLARANPRAQHITVPDAAHGLPYTHPQPIQQAVQGFLKEFGSF